MNRLPQRHLPPGVFILSALPMPWQHELKYSVGMEGYGVWLDAHGLDPDVEEMPEWLELRCFGEDGWDPKKYLHYDNMIIAAFCEDPAADGPIMQREPYVELDPDANGHGASPPDW